MSNLTNVIIFLFVLVVLVFLSIILYFVFEDKSNDNNNNDTSTDTTTNTSSITDSTTLTSTSTNNLPISGQSYLINNASTSQMIYFCGTCVSCEMAYPASGLLLTNNTATANNLSNWLFTLVEGTSDTYTLQSPSSTPSGYNYASTSNRAGCQTTSFHLGANQADIGKSLAQFIITPVPNTSFFTIQSADSNLYLTTCTSSNNCFQYWITIFGVGGMTFVNSVTNSSAYSAYWYFTQV
jgi:hypothetical protein